MFTSVALTTLADLERPRVIHAADQYLAAVPQTMTSFRAPRSAGGPHDFFSEGDYWWPDAAHPGGPYVRRDGESNPDNFVEHRRALIRLSVEVPALTAAWMLAATFDVLRCASGSWPCRPRV